MYIIAKRFTVHSRGLNSKECCQFGLSLDQMCLLLSFCTLSASVLLDAFYQSPAGLVQKRLHIIQIGNIHEDTSALGGPLAHF